MRSILRLVSTEAYGVTNVTLCSQKTKFYSKPPATFCIRTPESMNLLRVELFVEYMSFPSYSTPLCTRASLFITQKGPLMGRLLYADVHKKEWRLLETEFPFSEKTVSSLCFRKLPYRVNHFRSKISFLSLLVNGECRWEVFEWNNFFHLSLRMKSNHGRSRLTLVFIWCELLSKPDLSFGAYADKKLAESWTRVRKT